MQILAFFSNQILVIKGHNSYQKQCFMKIALLNVKTYIQKLSYVFLLQHVSNNHKIQFFQNKVSEQFSSHCI